MLISRCAKPMCTKTAVISRHHWPFMVRGPKLAPQRNTWSPPNRRSWPVLRAIARKMARLMESKIMVPEICVLKGADEACGAEDVLLLTPVAGRGALG